MNADDPAVELRGVRAAYGTIEVLHGIDLKVPHGGIVALLGPNGEGKSTTLRVIAAQLAITGGDLLIAGQRVNGAAADELARRGVCLIPEGRGVFPNLTVRENLLMATHGGPTLDHIEAVTRQHFPQLLRKSRQLAGTLSGGEQQMLAMARALAVDPAVLLLDELSMGLAPLVVQELYEIVAELPSRGVAVLVVEQFARSVLRVADQVGIMVRGRITAFGTPAEIDDQLSIAYLGK